ncbi:carbohydrate porin [Bradyrhizobium sp. U87765 SZCCT0131]|nr:MULTISPECIES: carbohydrate porin [unclassified Bradyrhizobium]MBR1221148.1 carbohydrate porin [Bradyrhizobium sp. U87765 SZCCT0131]MBR1260031.1 carbohydrate porin [Bradyrhizobium sp. U87765 SZCCT0134]MBR1307720.1 carbohydrate porin [Bradyrhizobium sp. U87765 SZCCT0110]MBR1321674.1 carbohydrate porin [Bradyrhizobium sp. U87765 SZCCT0109]MBR1349986.1 carbohydrate porin [Bradyrhizobium sp. U87765 SZCCT0048]
MRWPALLGSLALVSLAGADRARSADLPLAPSAATAPLPDWNGIYFGAHAGFGYGHGRASVLDGDAVAGSHGFGGMIGGVQIGANRVLPSGLLLGVEVDAMLPNAYPSNGTVWTNTAADHAFAEQLDTIATVRGRLGYVRGHWLVYATAGLALSSSQVTRTSLAGDDDITKAMLRAGWAAGAGVEYRLSQDWSVRAEYLYARLGSRSLAFAPDSTYTASMDFSALRIGLNRQMSWSDAAAFKAPAIAAPEGSNWEIHGQTTYIHQAYPSFRSPYAGANSLNGAAQNKQTWSTSLYMTFGLWDGAELHFNPELLQGFGFNNTAGLAGFSNGEAQKSDFLYPHYNTSRLFVRQTFGFGGEQESVEGDYGQMSARRDISRLTVQVGKFAVHDVFDTNAYAQDPRVDFLNWSIWAAGAFDYPADKVGLTYGAVAEWNEKRWALRAGYFLTGSEPNSNTFDTAVLRRGAYVAEAEARTTFGGLPGKLRATAWLNNANSGSYRGAIDLSASIPGLAINDAIGLTREGRIKYGYVVGFEQALSESVGLFGRWSWNSGTSEISAFTDIDASLSGGLSIKGASWGRPADTIGIAGAVNMLSRDHRDYLALGGLGILIGDGALNYRPERIVEAYYAVSVRDGLVATLDYQHIVNPAYNADRGPVSIISGRVRASF